MDEFIEYLKYAKKSSVIKSLSTMTYCHIVLGNESCDLDSLISSLALGYLRYRQNCNTVKKIIPVLNISSQDFVIKTENGYILKKFGINQNILVFKNELNLQKIQDRQLLSVSLVDHHVLKSEDKFLEGSIIEIFDHRPVDPEVVWDPNQVKIVIDQVGSCSTLITNEILNYKNDILTPVLAELLYNVITFDTIGFCPKADKAKELDIKVSQQLIKQFNLNKDTKGVFNELWKAHIDVSELTPKQLLSKDLKVIKGLPVPGLPMLVKQYLTLPNVTIDMITFCEERGYSNMVIMGLHVIESEVHRDLAVFTCKEPNSLAKKIIKTLINAEEQGYDFGLEKQPVDIPNITYFVQKNIKLSRKQILPILKDIIL